LASHSEPEDQDFFVEVLDRHTDGNILKAALLFLGRWGEPSEVGEKVAALLDHPYSDVQEAALNACIALHDSAIVGNFLSMAGNPCPARRMMAVHALGAIDSLGFSHILTKALQDTDAQVRKVAIEALSSRTSAADAHVQQIAALADDPDSEVRLAVITALGACDTPHCDDYLLRGLSDADPWVRVRCIESLGRRRSIHSVSTLVEFLTDENPLIVVKTIEALGAIGGETAFRALFPLLDHGNQDIQHAAEESMARIHAGEGA
jgi:HEAT repeat protein